MRATCAPTTQYQQFIPLWSNKFTWVNGELGWGEGLGSRPYPVFKNFYAGGLGSVRAFEGRLAGCRPTTSEPASAAICAST
jgi:outer membrane protein insertion porin family